MIKIRTKIAICLLLIFISTATLFANCAKSGFVAAGSDLANGEPFYEMAWHLQNKSQKVFADNAGITGVDLNLQQSWSMGLTGEGVRILVSDDGVEDFHEDLHSNYVYGGFSKNYSKESPYFSETAPPLAANDNHGTSVAGLIAAAVNGKGSMGVAPRASIVAANFLSDVVDFSESIMLDQARGPFDIFNMSWGRTQNTLSVTPSILVTQFKSGTTTGRSGKGSIYIKSAGNDFLVPCNDSSADRCVGNANFDDDNISPYTIIVSSLNGKNNPASYSSIGSNIWISSFGGEYGGEQVNDLPAMVTTDRMGCSSGYSQKYSSSRVSFNKGAAGNYDCNYNVSFNGASAAAPVLSGAVALILQANPNLSWRDVKFILAKTAVPVNYATIGSFAHPLNEPVPPGAVWENAWIENKAGFKFHNWHGFGRVDVDVAVNLAKSYTSSFGPLQETNWAHQISGVSLAVPDFNGAGVSSTIDVDSNLKLEAVQLKISVTHTDISSLALELISPSGTKSILVNMNNSLRGITNYSNNVFLSNAFYGESSAGEWTLRVIDGRTGSTGTLTSWSLNFFGVN
jgi:subtilisin-like proprotein convertase family protein